jgi:hypothetical protein
VLYSLARFLQFLGLIMLPLAIMGEVSQTLTLKQSLVYSSVGIVTFFLGWLLQRNTKSR